MDKFSLWTSTEQKKSCIPIQKATKLSKKAKQMMSVGFEPTPMKTTALTLRLRPLGHDILF